MQYEHAGLLGSAFSMRGRWGNIGMLALVLAMILMVWARASLIVFALSWISIPLMLDRDTDAITAIIISFVALFINTPATLVWRV